LTAFKGPLTPVNEPLTAFKGPLTPVNEPLTTFNDLLIPPNRLPPAPKRPSVAAAMKFTRRSLLKGAGVAALVPSVKAYAWLDPKPSPRALAGVALKAAAAAGATYCDIRFVRRTDEWITSRDDAVHGITRSASAGAGVRVLKRGAWGFAATPDLSEAGLKRAVERAIALAEASAAIVSAPVQLSPEAVYQDSWQTPIQKDPFRVPLAHKIAMLLEVNKAARAAAALDAVEAYLAGAGEEKTFFSSEGSAIEQQLFRVTGGYELTAVDEKSGVYETRNFPNSSFGAGFEHFERIGFVERAGELAKQAREKVKADPPKPGPTDLVIAADNLWLTIHESIGHSTELDRVLGYEAGFAGTSFARPSDLGSLRYGGPLASFVADKTTPGGLATCGYDDDGVKTRRWDLVKQGVLVAFQTERDQFGLPGFGGSESRGGHSDGSAYADSWASVAFQRMPNVSLVPNPEKQSLDDLIAGVTDGILVEGNGSWSIDQQRKNFQFGGDYFWEIKNGKKQRPLRQVAYQSNTLEFWPKLDGLGDVSEWRLSGAMNDGKGQPVQDNAVSHGTPPARFRQVNVLDASKKGG
jgi:TldD protein